jgi:hypothetical protein
MLHYMRFTEEHAGADVQKLTAFNVEVRSRREDATANLRRYAKLLERHCPDNLLTAQLHTLVCRISAQERATGCTGMNGELWMERGVRLSRPLCPPFAALAHLSLPLSLCPSLPLAFAATIYTCHCITLSLSLSLSHTHTHTHTHTHKHRGFCLRHLPASQQRGTAQISRPGTQRTPAQTQVLVDQWALLYQSLHPAPVAEPARCRLAPRHQQARTLLSPRLRASQMFVSGGANSHSNAGGGRRCAGGHRRGCERRPPSGASVHAGTRH